MTLSKKPFENILRKGENAGLQAFYSFLRIIFYPIKDQKVLFDSLSVPRLQIVLFFQ